MRHKVSYWTVRALRYAPAVAFGLVIIAVIVLIKRPPQSAPERIRDVAGWGPSLVFAAIAVGWITMSAIELVKPYTRGLYHRHLLQRWLPGKNIDKVLLGKGQRLGARYFVELPIERLAAQLQAAGELAIAQAGESPPELVTTLLGQSALSQTPQQRSQALQRRLDQLQLIAESEWKPILRIGAIVCSSGLSFGGALLLGNRISDLGAVVPVVLSAGVVGGHFAGFSRDAVAVIERLRR